MAADRIRLGEADVMIAAGVESMSMVPMMGNKIAINPAILTRTRISRSPLAWPDRREGGGALEGCRARRRMRCSPEHQRAIQAIAKGEFKDEFLPTRLWIASPIWIAAR